MYLVLYSEQLFSLTYNSTREVSISEAIRLQLEDPEYLIVVSTNKTNVIIISNLLNLIINQQKQIVRDEMEQHCPSWFIQCA